MLGLGSLAVAYDRTLTAEILDVYTGALIDLTPNQLSRGFRRAIRELKWWPKPAEIRAYGIGEDLKDVSHEEYRLARLDEHERQHSLGCSPPLSGCAACEAEQNRREEEFRQYNLAKDALEAPLKALADSTREVSQATEAVRIAVDDFTRLNHDYAEFQRIVTLERTTDYFTRVAGYKENPPDFQLDYKRWLDMHRDQRGGWSESELIQCETVTLPRMKQKIDLAERTLGRRREELVTLRGKHAQLEVAAGVLMLPSGTEVEAA